MPNSALIVSFENQRPRLCTNLPDVTGVVIQKRFLLQRQQFNKLYAQGANGVLLALLTGERCAQAVPSKKESKTSCMCLKWRLHVTAKSSGLYK
jgi:hypothetical protein